MDTSNQFSDPAVPILAGEPTLDDNARADLHDAFYNKNADQLAQHLQALPLPDDFKKRFHDAKKQTEPIPDPVEKVVSVAQRIADLDPQVRQVAEASPNLLKAMTSAALTPDKDATAPTSAAPATTQGKSSASGKKTKTPALALPPRADGLQHLPPIADGHKRILASDGGIHDIPDANVEQAFSIDPRLHVMNP